MSGRGEKQARIRKRIGAIVTEDAIARERTWLASHLAFLDEGVPRRRSKSEKQRREQILADVAEKITMGALAYLRVRDPRAYGAILQSAEDYGRELIAGRPAVYRVGHLGRHERFWDRVENLAILEFHRELAWRLREAFRKELIVEHADSLLNISGDIRYGEAQRRGTLRRHARIQQRAEALSALVDEMLAEAGQEPANIDVRFAKRWITRLRTPARLSQQAIAHVLRRTPRMIKKQLVLAARQDREAKEYLPRARVRDAE